MSILKEIEKLEKELGYPSFHSNDDKKLEIRLRSLKRIKQLHKDAEQRKYIEPNCVSIFLNKLGNKIDKMMDKYWVDEDEDEDNEIFDMISQTDIYVEFENE
jgi:hypothetical protein